MEKLRRVKIGFLELDLAPGRYRLLTPQEIERFRKLLKMEDGRTFAETSEIRRTPSPWSGFPSNPMRPSNGVSEYMQRAGYRIIPVNPNETEVLGEKSYAPPRRRPGEDRHRRYFPAAPNTCRKSSNRRSASARKRFGCRKA